MKSKVQLHTALNYLISLVWIANGLFCKVLNLVPRHQQIVSKILGEEYAEVYTKLIGAAEILMAIWILSNLWQRFNAITQIMIIAAMNIVEFIIVPDFLLFGKVNAFFAFFLIISIYYNEFVLRSKLKR